MCCSGREGVVPKVIHYCWFGHGELSQTARKCLASWERYAPGYEIRRCDESVFDVDAHAWTRAAYAAGKYAYVADYARFWLVYHHGGVYMDLGSELVRDVAGLIAGTAPFSAIEEGSRTATPGLIMAAPAYSPLLASVLARYDALEFCDSPEFLDTHTVNEIFTQELERRGFVREDRLQQVGEWTLLQSDAFNPVYGFGGFHIRKGTYGVHHYSASWAEPKFRTKRAIVDRLAPFVGRRAAQIVGRTVAEVKHEGFASGMRNLYEVACNAAKR